MLSTNSQTHSFEHTLSNTYMGTTLNNKYLDTYSQIKRT
jgi:hypothetical protein